MGHGGQRGRSTSPGEHRDNGSTLLPTACQGEVMGRSELGPALGSSQPWEIGAIQQLGLGPVLSARSRGTSNALAGQ